jgi:HlyD family secretion protein
MAHLPQRRIRRQPAWPGYAVAVAVACLGVGCSQPQQPASPGNAEARGESPAVVDVATAQPANGDGRVYTGTTEPVQQVSLRSQAEGQLLSLAVDVGDSVQPGQTLGSLDNTLLQTALGEAEAELAARQFEVARAEAELADMRTLIEQARVRLQQASNDAQRLQSLASQGAISTQEAEQAQTTLETAQQGFQSANEQLRTRQQAIAAAQQRVTAQQAIVQQARKRLTYATLSTPLNGVVLERLADPGDLIQPGQAVLTIGDMAEIHVITEVADRNRQEFNLGQSVAVQLDAFPGETFNGRVTRISPVADSTSRLIPIEITLANPGNRIGSGLLARISPTPTQTTTVLVPRSALEINEGSNNQLFLVSTTDDQTIVTARTVQIGERTQNRVEILSGLAPGEPYVLRSNQPLETGQVVEKSLVSE